MRWSKTVFSSQMQSSLLECSHLFLNAVIYSQMQSSFLECSHLFSNAVIYSQMQSSILKCSHQFSNAVIFSQMQSSILKCGHLFSNAVTFSWMQTFLHKIYPLSIFRWPEIHSSLRQSSLSSPFLIANCHRKSSSNCLFYLTQTFRFSSFSTTKHR